MTLLLLGIALFFVAHSVSIFALGWRNAMARKLGDAPWKLIYGLVSLAGFILMVKGYAAAKLGLFQGENASLKSTFSELDLIHDHTGAPNCAGAGETDAPMNSCGSEVVARSWC